MKLDEIRQSYDAIISLGSNCQPAYQLERMQLRNSSGPLDWMISHSLPQVSLLIRKNFSDFMDFDNLTLEGIEPGSPHYTVRDTVNNCISLHDFPIEKNLKDSFPEIKFKLDRRINRILEKFNNCKSILFIRVMGGYDDVIDLNISLSEKVKNKFNILLINYHESDQISEENWGLSNICSIKIPNDFTRWQGDDECWNKLFEGVKLVNDI